MPSRFFLAQLLYNLYYVIWVCRRAGGIVMFSANNSNVAKQVDRHDGGELKNKKRITPDKASVLKIKRPVFTGLDAMSAKHCYFKNAFSISAMPCNTKPIATISLSGFLNFMIGRFKSEGAIA